MNSGKNTRSRTLLVAAIVIAACIALRLVVHEPSYDVTVSSKSDGIAIEWSTCGLKRLGGADSVLIIPADADKNPSCRLRPLDKAQLPPTLPGSWSYGSIPTGYVLDGTCPELGSNRRLRARVGGRIGGEVVFRVVPGNKIEIEDRSCGWLDRLL